MTTATMDRQLMTPAEVAGMLGVQVQTLTAWRCRGSHSLKFVKVGRSVRYRRSDVADWLDRRTATCSSTAAH